MFVANSYIAATAGIPPATNDVQRRQSTTTAQFSAAVLRFSF